MKTRSSAFGFAAFADGMECCAECGAPADDERAVVRDRWRVCGDCRNAWVKDREWIKLEPADAHALIDAGVEIECADCGDLVPPGGPLRVWTNALGEIARAYCGACVRMFAARQRVVRTKGEILKRVGRGRSKGWLSRELVAEGLYLSDVREAFAELLEEGQLVQHGGTVRRPRQAETLF